MSYLDLDFKLSSHLKKQVAVSPTKNNKSSFRFITLAVVTSLITIGLYTFFSSATIKQPSTRQSANADLPRLQTINATSSSPAIALIEPIVVTIKDGDSLSSIFNKQGIGASVLFKIMKQTEHSKRLKKIKKGQTLKFHYTQDKTLSHFSYHPDITESLIFTNLGDNKFSSKQQIEKLEAIPTYREGTIQNSLFLAASANNIPDSIIMNLVGIFGWDIDFALDIRSGDNFKVIYNELYKDGDKITNGQILAAEFTNRNTTYQAIRFTDLDGNSNYFSPDGKSMRKAFLRNPVEFSRISSRFTNSRKHPIHGFKRPHRGVDYAASKGTPVQSAGDGKIIFRGNKGGYGRTVIVQHGGKYTTLYAHLNSYNRKFKKGARVKQGQTIGYVGKSGTATGYHLHYEFRVSGSHRNPLTVKLPAAKPINKKYNDEFNQQKDSLLTMLRIMDQTPNAIL
ncbi:MAG: peptidoglycan DD-metalloendopeptidase family protein [Gammaproteobacteria bacterium]|nr:peptidoglycan DD-metalloendopeptidase family protein [Gammaproteobacteria bacterium]